MKSIMSNLYMARVDIHGARNDPKLGVRHVLHERGHLLWVVDVHVQALQTVLRGHQDVRALRKSGEVVKVAWHRTARKREEEGRMRQGLGKTEEKEKGREGQ